MSAPAPTAPMSVPHPMSAPAPTAPMSVPHPMSAPAPSAPMSAPHPMSASASAKPPTYAAAVRSQMPASAPEMPRIYYGDPTHPSYPRDLVDKYLS